MADFNPADFGATPAAAPAAPAASASFDPSQFGATPAAAPAPAPAPAPEGDALDKITGAINSVLPGKQVGSAIGTLGGYGIAAFTDLLNHLQGNPTTLAKNYDLSAPSPLQTTGDVLKGSALVGSAAIPGAESLGEAALQGAGIGAAAGAGQAATDTSGNAVPTSTDLIQTLKGAGAGAAVGAGSNVAAFGIGNMLGALGNKITDSVIKPSQRDIKDGFSISTVNKYDLGGSLSTMYNKTEAALSNLASQLNAKLASSPASVNLQDVYKNTEASLATNKAQGFGSNTSIGNALQQLKNEIGALDAPQVSIPQAQLVKQATGKMGAWQYGAQDPEATAREKVYNTFYGHLKQAIEDNSPAGVRDINKQISDLIPVQNAIVRRIPVAERNNALSLTDMVGLVGSAMNPHALAGLGISLAQKSGTVGHLLSRFVGPAVRRAGVPAAAGASALGSAVATGAGNTQ